MASDEAGTRSAFSGLAADHQAAAPHAPARGAGLPGAVATPIPPVEWMDVTAQVREACASLGVGGIVKRETFTLQDSMNALELMSPKMDAGMNALATPTVRERLDAGTLPIPPASILDLASVCDLMSCMEVAYRNGHSLPTSLHACVYLSEDGLAAIQEQATPILMRLGAEVFTLSEEDSDESIIAAVALVLFMSYLKSAWSMRRIVRLADMYEEEDFVPSHFGLSLAEDVDIRELDELLGAVRNLVLARASAPNPDPAFCAKGVELILARIDYRRQYLDLLLEVTKPNLEGIPRVFELLPTILANLKGPAALYRSDSSEEEKASAERVRAFTVDATINRKILASSPPRADPPLNLEASQRDAVRHLEHLGEMCKLVDETSLLGLYEALLHFTSNLPDIVTRSLLIPVLYTENKLALGKFTYEEWITHSLRDFGMPSPDLTTKTCKGFVEALVKPVYEMLRVLTGNRARQRRNIANILPDWGVVQQEAEVQDQLLLFEANPDLDENELSKMQPSQLREILHFSLHGWVTVWIIRLMSHHLKLGFELELYQKYEHDIMFWYLSFLQSRQRDMQNEMESYLSRRLMHALNTEKSSKSDDTKRKAKKEGKSLRLQLLAMRGDILLAREKCFVELSQLLSEGLLRLLIAFRKRGILVNPQFSFGSPQIRFNHRIAAYRAVNQPPTLSFESYCSVTDLSKYEAATLFTHAKGFLDKVKETVSALIKGKTFTDAASVQHLRGLLKVVIGNSILITRELDAAAGAGGRQLDAEFSAHCAFPLFQLSPAKAS